MRLHCITSPTPAAPTPVTPVAFFYAMGPDCIEDIYHTTTYLSISIALASTVSNAILLTPHFAWWMCILIIVMEKGGKERDC